MFVMQIQFYDTFTLQYTNQINSVLDKIMEPLLKSIF